MKESDKLKREAAHVEKLMLQVELLLNELGGPEADPAGADQQVFQQLLANYDELDPGEREELVALSKEVGAEFVDELGLKISAPGKFEFELADDGTEVRMTLTPPLGDGKMVSELEIFAALADEGVKVGLDNQAIAAAVAAVRETGEPVAGAVVARAEPPVNGRDGFLDYAVQPQRRDERDRDEEVEAGAEDGRRPAAGTAMVEAGQSLAVEVPPTAGKPGRDVFNEPLPAADGRGAIVAAGDNVDFIPDRNEYRATAAGRLVLTGNRLCVDEQLVIPGDVDLAVGNVEFPGTILIKGFVRSGLRVKAGKEVEILGGVEAAAVEAVAGSVRIAQGVQGNHHALIVAGTDVQAKFIENATVFAQRDVTVQVAVVNSEITAGNQVRVSIRKGAIIGGTIRAGQFIRAKEIGSVAGVATELVLGITPEILRRILQFDDERIQLEKKRVTIEATLAGLQHFVGKLDKIPFEKRQSIIRLKKLLLVCKYRIRGLVRDKEQFLAEAQHHRSGRIEVFNMLYPNVRVTIGRSRLTVKNEQRYLSLSESQEEGRIVTGRL